MKEENATKASMNPWFIISARSKARFAWDVVIIIFAIQNAITLPMEIAFEEELSDIPALKYLDYVTTAVFTLDIIAGFITSYIEVSTGEQIFAMRPIAINYICAGPFLIDIFSTFPLDAIAKPFAPKDANGILTTQGNTVVRTLKILGFLKMQRLRRIAKIIGQMNMTQESKALLKVIKMVVFLIIYIHLLACVLWTTVNVENHQWIPAVDFIYAETKLYREEMTKQYLSMAYHAIMVFGLNEVAPVLDLEIVVVIIMMIISAMCNAWIFGEMAMLV